VTRRVTPSPLSGSCRNCCAFAKGEREKIPFSTNLRSKVPQDMHIEEFLSMLRFKNKAKLDDLGLEIDTNTTKFYD
jgi:hypothetical protein